MVSKKTSKMELEVRAMIRECFINSGDLEEFRRRFDSGKVKLRSGNHLDVSITYECVMLAEEAIVRHIGITHRRIVATVRKEVIDGV
jgi:hypothetical protein